MYTFYKAANKQIFLSELITESLSLEKSCKTINSSFWPDNVMPIQSISKRATYTYFFNTFRDGVSTTSLGSLFWSLTTLSVKKN